MITLMKNNIPQSKIIIEYFKKHPNKNIKHPKVVDWAMREYEKRTGEKFRDPDREIRKLAQEGILIKIAKGVYKFDPNVVKKIVRHKILQPRNNIRTRINL